MNYRNMGYIQLPHKLYYITRQWVYLNRKKNEELTSC